MFQQFYDLIGYPHKSFDTIVNTIGHNRLKQTSTLKNKNNDTDETKVIQLTPPYMDKHSTNTTIYG